MRGVCVYNMRYKDWLGPIKTGYCWLFHNSKIGTNRRLDRSYGYPWLVYFVVTTS
jgi:hypothetical protein